jgi:hypothetical protein
MFEPFTESVREFPKGEGERKKLKGRSPVPLSGTIKEPHTDKYPNRIHHSSPNGFLSFKNSQRGRGFKNSH